VDDLTIQDLIVERGTRVVLSGCTAEFASARRTVLWGRSGTGKSTLLSAIAGLISPRAGTIRMGSRVLFSRADRIDVPPHERKIGFVFQDLALWPHLSAMNHVYLVGRPAGLDREAAKRLLESTGLAGLDDRRPGELSGGEQQRLAIARALAGEPSMLLLDEPFSSVDRTTKDSLYELLRHFSPQIPGPTIYVTHHADDAASLAESVMTLQDGKLAPGERPWDRGQ
jgi:ABC-type sulfate/molybdate transport systems ATPase subunit